MTSWLAVLDTVTGLTLLVAGLAAWRGRPSSRAGLLMMLAAGCWFAGSLVGVLAFVHRGPLVQLHVSYPTGRVHRRPALVVVGLAWVAGLLEGVVRVPWVTLGLSVVVALAALDIYLRSSGNARKAGGPALVSALLFASVLALASVDRLADLRWDSGIAVVYDVVVIAVAAWLTVDLLTGRWSEATVADLVSQLGGDADTSGVRAALRRALGDPELAVGYRVPGRDAYVDDDGRPVDVEPRSDQVVTVIEDDGAPVAVLVHAASALDDPELTRAAVAAVQLAVGNAVLRAQVGARTQELTAARRGLVEAADRQRAALAADLDEGADRHLARVDVLLHGLGAEELRAELSEARADLRALAAGIRPPGLVSDGLAGTLPVLAARSPVSTTTDLHIGRLAPAHESALYFVCAEALTNVAKHARATAAHIEAQEVAGWVVLTVSDDGRGAADASGSGLRGLADRVEALGGSLTVEAASGGGTTIRASLPVEQEDGT
jgi:signal transduction histidine kinase